MIKKMFSAVSRFDMLSSGSDVLVGLSGGADSVAMLLGLIAIRESYDISVRAIHINHNIRGEEALRDCSFCESLCKKMNIPLIVESVDIPSIARQTGESTELCARRIRYELFSKHAKNVIATAHTADDNVETVLFNLTRGTGGKGLCGIPPVRDNIIRPIILCSRKDVLNYLKEQDQKYVTDSSNLSDDYTRNRIRHNVIPELRGINPALSDSLARASDNIREDIEFIQNFAKNEFDKLIFSEDGEWYLKSEAENFDIAIRKRFYIFFCEKNGISKSFLDYNKLNEIDKVVLRKIKRTFICEGLYFSRSKKSFYIEKGIQKIQSENEFSFDNDKNFQITTLENYKKSKKINSLLFKFSLDCDKIKGTLTVSGRRDGDKYRPVGRNVTKTLKKLLNESGLSPSQKATLFVISDEQGIIFTNLFGIDERVKVDDNSNSIVVYGNVQEGKN